MFNDRRRWLAGGAVVAVLGVIAWWQMSPATPEAASGRPAAGARDGRPRADAAAEPPPPVRLGALTASREQPNGTSRNPFVFQPRVAAATPRPVAATPDPEAQRPVMPTVPAGPPPAPPPPPIPLKFIGVVERANGVKWAVLSDGRVTLHGRDGDIIDGRYRIVKIGAESIELTYADGRGRQTVRLTGQ